MRRWLQATAAALAGAVIGALLVMAFDRPASGGEAVRGYLLAHPEVIAEAMDALRDRETGRAIGADRRAIETPVGGAWSGGPKGDVTLVEYFDYNCGYCRADLPVLSALTKADPRVRVVYRELPVLARSSHAAALASLAAAHQGRFLPFRDALYAAGPVSAAGIAATARATGVALPPKAAPADEAEIAANLRTAGRLGIVGTPGWVVADRVLVGAQTLEQLQAAVAAARGR